MNSYLKLLFSGFECSHVVETHFPPFPCRLAVPSLTHEASSPAHRYMEAVTHTDVTWSGGGGNYKGLTYVIRP